MAAPKGSFAEMLRQARIAKEFTLREVASFTGLSAGNISEMESGRRLPPKDENILFKLAKLLGINRDELCEKAKITRKFKSEGVLEDVLLGDPELALNFYRVVEDRTGDDVRKALRHALQFLNDNKDDCSA